MPIFLKLTLLTAYVWHRNILGHKLSSYIKSVFQNLRLTCSMPTKVLLIYKLLYSSCILLNPQKRRKRRSCRKRACRCDWALIKVHQRSKLTWYQVILTLSMQVESIFLKFLSLTMHSTHCVTGIGLFYVMRDLIAQQLARGQYYAERSQKLLHLGQYWYMLLLKNKRSNRNRYAFVKDTPSKR